MYALLKYNAKSGAVKAHKESRVEMRIRIAARDVGSRVRIADDPTLFPTPPTVAFRMEHDFRRRHRLFGSDAPGRRDVATPVTDRIFLPN